MKKKNGIKIANWSGVSTLVEHAYFIDPTTSFDEIKGVEHPMTYRGLGKNYTDAGLNEQNVIVNISRNKVISFDQSSGVIRVESGMVLNDLLAHVIPKNWIVSTIPGTAFVTIGGMLASNIHGKNNYRQGSFSDHVREITLRTPDNQVHICSPQRESDLFNATVAGMGSTGLIEEVEIQLQKIHSPYVRAKYQKTQTIEHQVDTMKKLQGEKDFMIGWLDHASFRENRAHGILEISNFEPNQTNHTPKKSHVQLLNVPFTLPFSIVNNWTTKIFNQLNYARSYPESSVMEFNNFNFKLDAVGNWNRLFGPRGLVQYQCLIPDGPKQIQNIKYVLRFFKEKGIISSLITVKLHKNENHGFLSYSLNGISIALDFPYHESRIQKLHALNEWLIDQGGRVYLTKDRTLDANLFEKMYASGLQSQRKILDRIDPASKIGSLWSKRLRLRG
jgi:decaprenylphospho-beta-D-ribofuranose 2-oxidase